MTSSSPLHRRQALTLFAKGTACASLGLASPFVHAQEIRRVRYVLALPLMSAIVSNQTSIPQALGYYEQERVRVEPVLAGAAGTTGAVQLVATGDRDIGSGSYTPMLARAAQGQDMGLTCFYQQVRRFAPEIAVLTDHPARSIKDLRTKLIGVTTLATESVNVTRFVARDAGMDVDNDLHFIAVGAGAQAGQALRSRQIDAYAAPRSQIEQIGAALGLSLRLLPQPQKLRELFSVCLFARRDFLKTQRATAVGIGRAVAKGTLFMLTNPEAAIRLHWKTYPEQMPQGVAPEKALADALRVLHVQLEGLRFQDHENTDRFGMFRPEAVAALLDVFGWSGKVQHPGQYFSNELIAEINDFDRNKVIAEARNFKLS